MARWGKVDFRQLERLQKRMQKLTSVQVDEFCISASKELAARLLAKVIKRTPVGQYEDGTVGGTLRRGWTSTSHREAELSSTFGGGNGAKGFADSMMVTKTGNTYQVEVINPVEYAMYVELGHRTANHKGWVSGRFMMTISANEVDKQAPQILQRKFDKFLREAFNGNQSNH